MKKVFVLTLMTLFTATVPVSAYASEIQGSWIKEDPNPGKSKVTKEEAVKAWVITPDGKKTFVKPVEKLTTNGLIQTNSFTDSSGFQYYYDHYEPNWNDLDYYHFFVGAVNYRNNSGNQQSMSYQQQTTKTNAWTFTGRVSLEVGLSAALLANAKFSAGFDVQKQTTTAASTTVTGNATVSPYYSGTLTCYDAGAYSGGAGAWRKYSPSGTSLLGMYYENTSAWTVATNTKTFSYTETHI